MPHRVRLRWIGKRGLLLLRGLMFAGWTFQCPCCEWRLRAFTKKRGLFASSVDGYCPRCNAKARHRRQWLYLRQHSDILSKPQTLLEVAPWWSMARRFRRMRHLNYLGLDLQYTGPHVNLLGDVRDCPLPADSIDTLLCIHVLEHVDNDRKAMSEMYRILRPGGTALVSVPLALDRDTREDPGVTDPEERQRLFGERSHLRWYGRDIIGRLEESGFRVALHPGQELPQAECSSFGLRRDENVLHCRKPRPAAAVPDLPA